MSIALKMIAVVILAVAVIVVVVLGGSSSVSGRRRNSSTSSRSNCNYGLSCGDSFIQFLQSDMFLWLWISANKESQMDSPTLFSVRLIRVQFQR